MFRAKRQGDPLLAFIVCLLIGGALIAITLNTQFQWDRMEREGVPAQAAILEMYTTERGKNNTVFHHIHYSYTVNGVTYAKTQEVTKETYNLLRGRSAAHILMLPDDPATSVIAGDRPNQDMLLVSGGVFLLLAVVAGAFLFRR